MAYKYTSFFSSMSSVCMQLMMSGNSGDTSLPTVMAAMTGFSKKSISTR